MQAHKVLILVDSVGKISCIPAALVQAAEVQDCVIYHAYSPTSIELLADSKLPDTIQLFPPGSHTIVAQKDGKPAKVDVTVNAKVAQVVQKDVTEFIAAANAGTGPRPFIDFNHEDREASGWVTEVYWAGEDPKTGGVRAKIDWSKPGAEAIQGKAFRQFSPNFRVSTDTGEIIGTTANMGGLVNRPAFRAIQPFFASEPGGTQGGGGSNNGEPHTMNKLHQALVAAGLLSVIPTDEAAAVIEFNAKWNTVQAKIAKGDADARTVETLQPQVTALTSERDTYKAKADEAARANAETIVAGWIKDGVLAPKDEDGKKLWTELLAKDLTQAKLMAPVISAKAAAAGGAGGAADPTNPVVKNGDGTGKGGNQPGAAKEHAFEVKAKEIQARDKCDKNTAIVKAAQENPDMYTAYRNGILFVETPKAPGQQ